MILTDRFVYIHLPKTGGTFVTAILERLLKPPKPRNFVERLSRRLRGKRYRDSNKHGVCNEVPDSHRHLPLVSCFRNPLDRYASAYDFGWWKDKPPKWADLEGIKRRFPSFPEVTFEEYIEAACMGFQRLKGSPLPPEKSLGFHSEQFVRYFFRDPEGAWKRIDDAYIAARGWEKDMHPVRFLRTDHLNEDLHAFLLEVGFPREEIAFVLEEGKILPAGAKRPRGRPWEECYTPELRALVRSRERLLFAMFPEYATEPAAPGKPK